MNAIIVRFLKMIYFSYYNEQIFWTIAPLMFSLMMAQMYFGKYKTEEMGWNSAFTNSISLIWVTATLIKFLHSEYGLYSFIFLDSLRGYLILMSVFLILTLLISYLNFNHYIPKYWAFLLSSSLLINIIAYIVIIIIMAKFPLDIVTMDASIILFVLLLATFGLYKYSITPAKSIIPTLKKHEKLQNQKIRKIKHKIKQAIDDVPLVGSNKKVKKKK